jgi:hypothetical protein
MLHAISENKVLSRDTIVFRWPEKVLSFLPDDVQRRWESYNSQLKEYGRKWNLGPGPTLKRFVRCYRSRTIVLPREMEVKTICHRFGAIPALVVGEDQGYNLALLNEPWARDERRYSVEEAEEVLKSLGEFLPQLLTAYYERIANYFQAIFFGCPEEKVTQFCLRIREQISESIRSKLGFVVACLRRASSSVCEKAQALNDSQGPWLREARSVDSFAHLLVNYIYRFYCIRDRVSDYEMRLKSQLTSGDLPDENRARFISSSCF